MKFKFTVGDIVKDRTFKDTYKVIWRGKHNKHKNVYKVRLVTGVGSHGREEYWGEDDLYLKRTEPTQSTLFHIPTKEEIVNEIISLLKVEESKKEAMKIQLMKVNKPEIKDLHYYIEEKIKN